MEKGKKAPRMGSTPGCRAGEAGKQGLAPFLQAIEGRRAVLVVPLGERKGEGHGGPA